MCSKKYPFEGMLRLGGVNSNRSAGPGRRYLIETDPRFVNYDNFISSDYLLDKQRV
nr:hypothetical protein [Xanthomonas translucens]